MSESYFDSRNEVKVPSFLKRRDSKSCRNLMDVPIGDGIFEIHQVSDQNMAVREIISYVNRRIKISGNTRVIFSVRLPQNEWAAIRSMIVKMAESCSLEVGHGSLAGSTFYPISDEMRFKIAT